MSPAKQAVGMSCKPPVVVSALQARRGLELTTASGQSWNSPGVVEEVWRQLTGLQRPEESWAGMHAGLYWPAGVSAADLTGGAVAGMRWASHTDLSHVPACSRQRCDL